MPGTISIYDPRTMGKLVERMPKVHTFIKSTFFRNVETFNTRKIDVDFKKGNRQLAPFVHKKIGGVTIENEGYQTNTYEPPLVAPNTITTIDDILERTPGESLHNGKHPNQRAVEKMQSDFHKLDEMITRREEWMCCQALFTGRIPILDKEGKKIQEEIDFGFTNKVDLPDKEKWDKTTGGKLEQLEEWRDKVQETGFVNCDVCLMGKDALNAFLKDKEVKEVLDNRRYELAVIKPRELPNGATYVGTLHSIGMDIYKYKEMYLDNWTNPLKPENKYLLPSNTLALLSTEAEYSMYYGAVGIADETGKTIAVAEGTRIPEQWIKRNPARRFLQLNAAPLCVPHEVDSWFVAAVCSDRPRAV